jgi:hypothetical protein
VTGKSDARPPLQPAFEALRRRGWTVEPAGEARAPFPAVVAERYRALPADVVAALSGLRACRNPRDDVWVLTPAELARTEADGFRWNEFETMSLEAAAGDPPWQHRIRAFWDACFVFMMAVHGDYEYLAVDLGRDGGTFGAIVHGIAPEFEEVTVVAGSFAEFLALLEREASTPAPAPDGPLGAFLRV